MPKRIQSSGYRTIVADPPWPQKGGGSLPRVGQRAIPLGGISGFIDAGGPSLPLPYKTMTIEAIAGLCPLAADDSHLYLWTTSGFLDAAFDVMGAWGFDYSTTLVWAKAPIGKGLGGAYGIATEFVLFGRRGSLPARIKVGRNWFEWKRPYDERGKPRHSAKPPEFYAMVEQVSPGPYLEMFARDFRLGWDAWGDEAPPFSAPIVAPLVAQSPPEDRSMHESGKLVPHTGFEPRPERSGPRRSATVG